MKPSIEICNPDEKEANHIAFENVLKMDDGTVGDISVNKMSDIMKTFEKTTFQSVSMRKSYASRNDNFQVWVRIRPLGDKEKRYAFNWSLSLISTHNNQTILLYRQYKQDKTEEANIWVAYDEYSVGLFFKFKMLHFNLCFT